MPPPDFLAPPQQPSSSASSPSQSPSPSSSTHGCTHEPSPIDRARQAMPASRKVRVHGHQPGVSVPMRAIALTNGEEVTVYDTSGPYTDPAALIDLHRGLETVRSRWIASRGDTESYAGRAPRVADDDRRAAAHPGEAAAARLASVRRDAAGLQRTPRRAMPGRNVTQMHYARRGIVTPEMEYVAIREAGRREWMNEYLGDAARELRLRGDALGAGMPEHLSLIHI